MPPTPRATRFAWSWATSGPAIAFAQGSIRGNGPDQEDGRAAIERVQGLAAGHGRSRAPAGW